jgi:hypothetical protein
MQRPIYATLSALLVTAVAGQTAFMSVTDPAGLQKAITDGTTHIEITEHLDMTKVAGFDGTKGMSPMPTTFSIVVRTSNNQGVDIS